MFVPAAESLLIRGPDPAVGLQIEVGGRPGGARSCSPPRPPLSDKLFGKRLLQAGRYIMSHKAWMKTVPTENCDVLMTFPGREMRGVPAAGSGLGRGGEEGSDGTRSSSQPPYPRWGHGEGRGWGTRGRRGPVRAVPCAPRHHGRPHAALAAQPHPPRHPRAHRAGPAPQAHPRLRLLRHRHLREVGSRPRPRPWVHPPRPSPAPSATSPAVSPLPAASCVGPMRSGCGSR